MISDSMRNNKMYNGHYAKFGVTINGEDYIIKGNDGGIFAITEYLASSFINRVGLVPCQTVHLDMYNGNIVCVIKDFCNSNEVLHTFKGTKQSSVDTELTDKEYNYKDVLYIINKHLKLAKDSKSKAISNFWWMFIFDALLGNRDRHWGNWGYIASENVYRPAPIYDNAGCLHPNFFGMNKALRVVEVDAYSMDSYTFFRYAILKGAPSQLLFRRKRTRFDKGNYYSMFGDLRVNKVFAKYVRQLRNTLSYEDVFKLMYNLVRDIPVDGVYKQFCVEYVTLRFLVILNRVDFDSAYKVVLNLEGKL